VDKNGPLQIVGALNAYTACQAEQIGFKSIYVSGGGVALGSLGQPDLGVTNLNDVLIDVRRITRVCNLPVLVDVDTGFGSVLNIARTVSDMEAVGAAAIHIEDQVVAKRCGHRPGKQVVSAGEMVARITAAVNARRDPDFFIMARTDALAVEGMGKAIDRAKKYVAAGADGIFAEALTKLDQYREFSAALPGVPLLANMTEFGKTELFTKEELHAHGATMILYPLSAFRAQSKGAEQTYKTILNTGCNKGAVPIMNTREETYKVIDYHKYEAMMDSAMNIEDK